MNKKPSFIICVDSREQAPYLFKNYPCQVKKAGLKTGDYSIEGYESEITIERKSKEDLYGSFSSGRERFAKEWERMSEFEYAALVIESSLKDILTPPDLSLMNPKSVIQSCISWNIRYGVYVFFADNRTLAQCFIFSIFEKFILNKTRKERVAA